MSRPTIEDLLGGGKPKTESDSSSESDSEFAPDRLPFVTTDQRRATPPPPPRNLPVGVTWLGEAFRMEWGTVKKRLGACPPAARGSNGSLMYDFVEAAGFLVKPKADVSAWMRAARTQDLPGYLQKEIWSAQRSKQLYEEHAGDLWRTSDVIDVLGEVFSHIKSSLQLIPENLERNAGLTEAQRVVCAQIIDSLQDDMHKKLVAMPGQRRTESSRAHVLVPGEEDAEF